MRFYELVLQVLLIMTLLQPCIAISPHTSLKAPDEPYKLHGSIRFGNGTYVDDAMFTVSYRHINSTAALVYVNVTGQLFVLNESNNVWRRAGVYDCTLRFIVDLRTNYAWLNGVFIGFFPFYIFPALGYDNVTKHRFVYLDKPLKVVTEAGRPVPIICHYDLGNGTVIEMPVLCMRNDYLSIEFVYHYPVTVECIIPLGDAKARVYARVSPEWVGYIYSIDDYPTSITYIDYLKVCVIAASVIAGLLIYMVLRRVWRR